MTARIYSLLVVAGIVVLSLTCGCKKKGSARRYLDPEGRFSIDVPAGWKVKQVRGKTAIEPRGPDEDPATLAIGVVRLKNPNQTLEEGAKKAIGRITADRRVRMIESGRTELAGKQAMRMRYSISKPGVGEGQFVVYVVLWEGNAVSVGFGAKPGSPKWTILESALKSFTLGD